MDIFQKTKQDLTSMENLIGKKIRTCVFISGTGSNLKAIIKNSRDYNFPAKIVLIITDQPKPYGLTYAKKYNIKYKIFVSKDKNLFEKKCLLELKKNKIKLICLAGFMKILSKKFIKKFNYKIINIHPSILPKYKGLNTHKRVLNKKEKYSGCTVHYVTTKLDSGMIVMQKKVSIKNDETEKSLKKKILQQEHLIYSQAIRKILN